MTRYTEPVQITFGGATLTFRAPEAGVIEVEGLEKSTGQKLMEAARSPTFFYELFGVSAPGADLPDPHETNTPAPAPGAEQAVAPQQRDPEYLRALAAPLTRLRGLEAGLTDLQTGCWRPADQRLACFVLEDTVEAGIRRGVQALDAIELLMRHAGPKARCLLEYIERMLGHRYWLEDPPRFELLRGHHTREHYWASSRLYRERGFDPFALGEALLAVERMRGEAADPGPTLAALLEPTGMLYAKVIAQIPHAQL